MFSNLSILLFKLSIYIETMKSNYIKKDFVTFQHLSDKIMSQVEKRSSLFNSVVVWNDLKFN